MVNQNPNQNPSREDRAKEGQNNQGNFKKDPQQYDSQEGRKRNDTPRDRG